MICIGDPSIDGTRSASGLTTFLSSCLICQWLWNCLALIAELRACADLRAMRRGCITFESWVSFLSGDRGGSGKSPKMSGSWSLVPP